jgi:hypothetical protein
MCRQSHKELVPIEEFRVVSPYSLEDGGSTVLQNGPIVFYREHKVLEPGDYLNIWIQFIFIIVNNNITKMEQPDAPPLLALSANRARGLPFFATLPLLLAYFY